MVRCRAVEVEEPGVAAGFKVGLLNLPGFQFYFMRKLFYKTYVGFERGK